MRLYSSIFLFFVFLGSCTQLKTAENNTLSEDSVVKKEVSTPYIQLPLDSSVYIGPIMAFTETSEYYTPIYYTADEDAYEYLGQQLDSVVYESEEYEMKRSRLPFSIAHQYFNLAGLGRISVYDKAGNLLTDATFQRVELLEGVLENEFVAVFKPMIPSRFTNEASYCVSSSLFPDFQTRLVSSQEIKDDILRNKLFRQFEIDSSRVWTYNHQVLKPHNTTFSIIATDAKSWLLETSNNESHILFETNSDYSIMDVSPLHLEVNGKPMLLALMGVNETDMIWTSLLVYNSTNYEVMHRGRILRE